MTNPSRGLDQSLLPFGDNSLDSMANSVFPLSSRLRKCAVLLARTIVNFMYNTENQVPDHLHKIVHEAATFVRTYRALRT